MWCDHTGPSKMMGMLNGLLQLDPFITLWSITGVICAYRLGQKESAQSALVQHSNIQTQFQTPTNRTETWSADRSIISIHPLFYPGFRLVLFHSGRSRVCLSSGAFFIDGLLLTAFHWFHHFRGRFSATCGTKWAAASAPVAHTQLGTMRQTSD